VQFFLFRLPPQRSHWLLNQTSPLWPEVD
jgi:hypothetical protein